MSNNSFLAQKTIITGKKNALSTNQIRHYRKNTLLVEIDSGSSIIPYIGRDALYLRHEAIKGQTSAPMRGNETHIRKCCEKGDDVVQRYISLAWIYMPYRFAAMREDQQLILAHNLHHGH